MKNIHEMPLSESGRQNEAHFARSPLAIPSAPHLFGRRTTEADQDTGWRVRWCLLLLWAGLGWSALGQGTAFTYQGRLSEGPNQATGLYDLRFGLYASATDGLLLSPGAITNAATAVTNGLFTVTLDFGPGVFDGSDRWLELAVRSAGGTNFETLRPRQAITATPYATYAGKSASANTAMVATQASFANTTPANGLTGTLAFWQLPGSLLTNGATGIQLSGVFTGNGAGITNVDLHTVNSDGTLFWTQHGPGFAATALAVGSTPHSVAVADVNGDGRLDLISANTSANTLTVLTNHGNDAFILAGTCPTGASPNRVVTADVNGDGRPDLVSANLDANTLTILTNSGQGNFGLSATVAVGSVPRSVVAADFNGDGWPDLASANTGSSTLSVLTNDGRGGLVLASSPAVGNQPYGAVVGDVNGDGKPDLISANFMANTLTVLTNSGQGRFATAATPAAGNRPYAVVVADINRDGRPDLISADAQGNTLTVLTNGGTFALAATVGAGSAPVSLAAADFNRDGWVDLACVNAYDQRLNVLTNNGRSGFALSHTNTVGATPWSVMTADVNGDGKMDLITANAGDDTLSVLLNTQPPPQLNLIGNGSGLTGLNPTNLTAGTAAINISGNSSTASLASSVATGAVGTAQLAPGAVTSDKIDDGGNAAYQLFLSTAQGMASGTALPFSALSQVGSDGSATMAFSINGAGVGSVVGFTSTEGISKLYTNYVQVRHKGSLNPESQIGATARLVVTHNGRTTAWGGIIAGCSAGGGSGSSGIHLYTFRIESTLANLAHSSDYRINQAQTTPDIVAGIFRAIGMTSFEPRLSGTYRPLPNSIQYNESNLGYVSRLLEQEGIYYFYDHNPGLPMLVMADSPSAHDTESAPSVSYYGDTETNLPPNGEIIRAFHKAAHQTTLQSAVNSYDFTAPRKALLAMATGTIGTGQHYEFGAPLTEMSDTDVRARIQQELQTWKHALISGASTSPDLRAGNLFNLNDQSGTELSGQYLVTEVRHAGFIRMVNGVRTLFYGNQFQTIPASLTYHPPPVTPKPQAQPCTAVVVGKAGEEIWIDKYGRVKVQFHWDRHGAGDETSSPWVRVATPMAGGHQRGMLFVPRIGDEVLVSFIMGDPDLPVITGSLFNSANMPAHSLPEAGTKSYIRTATSKGNVGGNEISFEDKAGSQLLQLSAAKDMELSAANSLTFSATTTTVNGTFNNNSDRTVKERFTPVSPADILHKVTQLPITEWSYRTDAATRHLGPMAQDFYSAFKVGSDERHIAPIDEGGVALAAIQGLNDKVETRSKQLEAENAVLKARLDQLEKLLNAMREGRGEK